MRAIGIRADKNGYHWVVVEAVEGEYILIADARSSAPASYDEPRALRWYHEHVQTLAREWDVQAAAVKHAETFFRNPRSRPSGSKLDSWLARARIEGVLTAALSDIGIDVRSDKWQTISSRLGSRSAKKYTEAGEFRGLDLSQLPNTRKELVSVAASMLEEQT